MSSIPATNLRTGDGHGPAADVADVLDRIRRIALLAGGAGIVLLLLGTLFHGVGAFFEVYLYAYVFWVGLALGSLALLMLQHLVGGGWGAVIQRPLEAASRMLPLLALLFVPVAAHVWMGRVYLYEWLDPAWRSAHPGHHFTFKLWYLSRAGFILRAIIYFALWILMAALLSAWSKRQDQSADPLIARRMQVVSGPGLVLYVVSVSLAVVDWVMSLSPDWYSTLFGLIFVVGQVLGTLAVMVALLAILSPRRPLAGVLAVGHFHDLGNLLLAFVMLWAYLTFAQFLIIWSGNIAEETPYYYTRTLTGWRYVGLLLVLFHFFVPFILLLWRRTKRSASMLIWVAAGLLVMRWIDLFWVMGPSFAYEPAHGQTGYAVAEAAARGANLPGVRTGGWCHLWMFPAAVAGLGGVWVLGYVSQLRRRPLLPLNDRRLEVAVAVAH